MKKLLLASDSNFLFSQGMSLIGIPKNQIKMAYVTTASKGNDNQDYVERHRKIMSEQRYDFEEIDIEVKSEKELEVLFKNKNVVHVEGGNTFYLLKATKESGFDKIIKRLVDDGVVYIGISAGAILACPTIEVCDWSPEPDVKYGVTDYSALGFVSFLLEVHYTDDMSRWLLEGIGKAKYPVRILRDGQGILVEGDKVTFVGSGEEVKL